MKVNYIFLQASERKLAPLKKEATLRELLMESIKKPPKPLRSTRIHDSPIVEMPLKRGKLQKNCIILHTFLYMFTIL